MGKSGIENTRGNAFNTGIPAEETTITVTGTSVHHSGALSGLGGQEIIVVAEGGNVTFRRGNQTVVLGRGPHLRDGEWAKFPVHPDDEADGLSVIGSGTCRLVLCYD